MNSASTLAAAGEFVAGGTYVYVLNDGPAGVTEPWTRHIRGDGVRITRSERLAPAFGSRVAVEAIERRTEGGDANWNVLVDWANSAPGAVPRARASYLITGDSVFCERVIGDAPPEFAEHDRPAQLQVAPLMRCFYGEVIRRVAGIGGGQPLPVFVPWIHDPHNGAMLLTAQFDPRRATVIDVDSLETDRGPVECIRYRFVGGNYTEASEFWVDEHGTLLRYRWPQRTDAVWDVRLTEYTRA